MLKVKIARLVTGEIVIFSEANSLDTASEVVTMVNPYVLMQSHQGATLAPLMPWVQKGVDYNIEVAKSNLLFYYPTEQSKTLADAYVQATSSIDLSASSNIRSFRP